MGLACIYANGEHSDTNDVVSKAVLLMTERTILGDHKNNFLEIFLSS